MSDASCSSCVTCACYFLGFERHSHAQCLILPQRQHSSPVGLLDASLDEEPPRPWPWPRPWPLPAPPPLTPLPEWFFASRFFLHGSYSSSVRYRFPSCCNDVGASSNASSTSFNRPVRSATDIVDTSSNVLIAIVICLKQRGRDQSIFTMISLSFTSLSSMERCAPMPLRRSA
jgi:hypothetical protein